MADKVHKNKIVPPNPNGKGGFGDHPEHRNSGTWQSEDSISFQYNKLMRMTPEEFEDYQPVTMAQKIAHKRLRIAVTEAGLLDTKEITDRTEGKSLQRSDITSNGEPLKTLLVEFIDGPEDSNTDT